MENKELIRRLLNFDDDEITDSSTGFNSVVGEEEINAKIICRELSKYMEIIDDYDRKKYGLDLIDYYIYDEENNTLILNDEDFNGCNTGYSKCFNVGIFVKDPKSVCDICRRYKGMKIEIPRCNIESYDTFSAERFVKEVLTGYTNRTGTGSRGHKNFIELGLIRCQNRIPRIISDDIFRTITVSLYMDDDYDGSPLVVGGSPNKPLQTKGYRDTYKLAIDISDMTKTIPSGLMTDQQFFDRYKSSDNPDNEERKSLYRRWKSATGVVHPDKANNIIPINLDIVVRDAEIGDFDIDNNQATWNGTPIEFIDDNDIGYNWWKDIFAVKLSLEDSTINLLKYDIHGIDLINVNGYQNIESIYSNSYNGRKFGALTPTRAKSLVRELNQRMKSPKQVTVR